MGRPAKPQILHVLQGTSRKDRDGKRAGELSLRSGDVGECPKWFRGAAREEWTRLAEDPDYKQVLAPAYRSALIEYCTLFARMIRDSMGKKPMGTSERQMLNSLRMQLGITPASQSKVKAPKVEKSKSKWDDD